MKKFDVKNNQLIGETYNKVLAEKMVWNPETERYEDPRTGEQVPAGAGQLGNPYGHEPTNPGHNIDPPEDKAQRNAAQQEKVIEAVEGLATQLAELHINLDDAINLWRSWVKAGKPPGGDDVPDPEGDPYNDPWGAVGAIAKNK